MQRENSPNHLMVHVLKTLGIFVIKLLQFFLLLPKNLMGRANVYDVWSDLFDDCGTAKCE